MYHSHSVTVVICYFYGIAISREPSWWRAMGYKGWVMGVMGYEPRNRSTVEYIGDKTKDPYQRVRQEAVRHSVVRCLICSFSKPEGDIQRAPSLQSPTIFRTLGLQLLQA